MEAKGCYKKHFLLLSVLFVLGNTCITAPARNADKYNFLVYLLTCFASLIFGIIAYFIPINVKTFIPIYLLSLFTFGDTFISFIRFISDNLLPYTPRVLIVIPFVLILVYLGFKKTSTLYKFSLICGFLSVAVVVFFFLSTFKDFEFKNIYIYDLPRFNTVVSQSVFYFKSLVIPSLLLGVFARQENIEKGVLLGGLSLGLLALAITVLNSVLLFGIRFSGALEYPYSMAGSTVTFGNLFTRLDGFLYFVYSATCIIKCIVGIFVIKKSRSVLAP